MELTEPLQNLQVKLLGSNTFSSEDFLELREDFFCCYSINAFALALIWSIYLDSPKTTYSDGDIEIDFVSEWMNYCWFESSLDP